MVLRRAGAVALLPLILAVTASPPAAAAPPAAAPATPAASATPAPAAPATPATPAAAPAEPLTDSSDKEDTRAVYVSGELGFARPDIGGIKNDLGFDKTVGNGLLAGLGLGYRYKPLRIGARFRTASTSEFSLWSLMGEVGYGLSFRPVSPVLFLRAGYAFSTSIDRSVIQSSLPKTNQLTPNVDVNGLVLGAELGASYWLTKFLRLGPFVGVDFTFLHRKQVDLPQSILPLDDATKNNKLFGDSGSGVGYTLNIGLRGTGDIGF